MKLDGLIEIKAGTDANITRHVKYSFYLKDLLGNLVMMVNSKPAVQGTEVGLRNIVAVRETGQG